MREPAKARRHFAHRSDSRCSGETALHQYAKEVLARDKRITIPGLILRDRHLEEVVHVGGKLDADRVDIETVEGDFQPDAMVFSGNHHIAVEFKVSHGVDAEKCAKVRRANCPMIEIDLAALRWRTLDADDLDRAILHEARRDWIYHPDNEQALRRLAARGEEDRNNAAERLRWHIMDRKPRAAVPDDWREEVLGSIAESGLDYLLEITTNYDHWFAASPRHWRAAAVYSHILVPSIRSREGASVTIKGEYGHEDNLASVLPDWMIRSDLDYSYNRETLERAGLSRERVGTPHWAVWDFLGKLAMETQAVYWDRDDQCYRVDPELHGRIFRHYHLAGRVGTIVSKLGQADSDAYLKKWLAKFNADGKCPNAHIWDGGEGYSALLSRIGDIEAMLQPYSEAPIPDDQCGLPLDDWISRLVQKRKAKKLADEEEAEKKRSSRRANLISAAERELKAEATGWLEVAKAPNFSSLLDWGSESDDHYWRAFGLIEKAGTERKQRLASEALEENRQKRLMSAAEIAFRDTARAQLFVRSAHPKLGGQRPVECCKTDADLNRVLLLLPSAR